MKACFLGSTGVVVETARLQRLAYNAAFKELGLSLYWNVATFCKLLEVPGGLRRLEAAFGDEWPEGLAEEVDALQLQHFERLAEGGLQARPGVIEVINFCKREGVKLAWVTTATPEHLDILFDRTAGIRREDFDLVTSDDDAELEKPSPAIYHRAMAALGVDAGDVIAVEDMPVNQAAAMQADLHCYLYPGEYAPVDHNVLVTRDLPETIARAHSLWSVGTAKLDRSPDPTGFPTRT